MKNISINLQPKSRETELHKARQLAREIGNQEIIALLEKYIPETIPTQASASASSSSAAPIEPPNLLPSVFISYLTVGDPVALVAIKSEISFHPQYLNGVDRYGNTPLMIAAEHSHDDIVRALLELGADKTVRNNAGHTALDIAHASEALANDLQRIARLEDIITMLNQG